MSKLPKIILLLVLMGTIATSQVQRSGPVRSAPVLGNPGPAIGSQDELQQYTAGGHILGFRKGEMFVASGDHALRVEFVNTNPVSPIGEGGFANPKKGHDEAPPLGRVTYRDLWDGVTVVYENHGSGVIKSTYHVEAGGTTAGDRVDEIRLRYNVPVKVDEAGDLVLSFPMGEMRESRPAAWQEIEGNRIPVEATYRLISEQEVGFKTGSYDSRYPLVIDPVLSWNTFLGSSTVDFSLSIAVDTSQNVYVTGDCYANWGSPVRPFSGSCDAFAAKLNGSGALQWNTFLGGSNNDFGHGITVDTSGNVYVAGFSSATWGSPVRPFAGGNDDAFVAKLNGSGALQWNTFLGGLGDDNGYAVAVDTSGNVYIAGYGSATWSSPVRPFGGGSYDAFAVKLNNSGLLQWNTFLGGSNNDYGRSITVDTSGNVYVAGDSNTTWGSPVRPFSGSSDAFTAKLNGSGVLQWNTFLGGLGSDYSYAIAVDTSGNVYVAGTSYVTWGSPVRPFAGGYYDAFTAKLNGSGVLQWNTFLGGSEGSDAGNGIAVDTSGNVYVAGDSDATWGSPVRPFASGRDAFAAKLNNSGALLWDTFLGGADTDYGSGIALDTSGNVYVTGYSSATWGSPIISFGGNCDAFVAKIQGGKVDFNGDGQDDILWRYYGSGGLNVVWEMGTGSIPALALGSQAKDNGGMNLLGGQEPGRIYWSPLEAGDLLSKRPAQRYRSALEVGLRKEIAAVYQAPWELWGKGKGTKVLASPMEGMTQAQTAPSILVSVPLYPVADTNWEIAGVGDFNGDGKPDILWRNYGTAGWTGTNLVWYMNGTTIAGQDLLYTVTDPNWRIEGVGDFNGDGKPDIVWRNYGTGMDVVWYMNGATITGQDVLYTVANPNWKIVGVGDFNGDGKPDIVWRDYGTGMNVVWYMNGAAIVGQDVLYTVADPNWRIEGVGDYNGDGKADILWRNYGSGGWTGTNLVWYMNGATIAGQDVLYPVTDLNWRIVIH